MIEIKENKIIIDKAEKTDIDPLIVGKYIKLLIYHTELERILNKTNFKKAKEELYNAYVDVDVLKCEEESICWVLKSKAKQFIKDRNDINDLKEACKELPSMQEFYSLSLTDKVHLILMAHVACKRVVLKNDLFYLSEFKLDLHSPSFKNFYGDYSKKDLLANQCRLKEKVECCLRKMLKQEGQYFYGIKIKRSDIIMEDIFCFWAALYKGEKPVDAFTDFCAVFLYSGKSKYTILNDILRSEIKIAADTFVIRCNVFHCTHESHKIKDIVALIDIIDDNGKKHVEKIPAGYCTECNLFFILESTFEYLKKKGMLLCRLTDIKNFNKTSHMNGEKLAHESLLMQYGYSVSQINNLSEERRKKILAVIIDDKILSKSEIISYLDFFINQRLSISNMETAITKWTEDRDFVQNYKMGAYAQFGVSALYRK